MHKYIFFAMLGFGIVEAAPFQVLVGYSFEGDHQKNNSSDFVIEFHEEDDLKLLRKSVAETWVHRAERFGPLKFKYTRSHSYYCSKRY